MSGLAGQAVSSLDISAKETSSAYREDITLRQNLDAKIEAHRAAIAELEAAKEQLTPLLDLRIDMLSRAMQIGRY